MVPCTRSKTNMDAVGGTVEVFLLLLAFVGVASTVDDTTLHPGLTVRIGERGLVRKGKTFFLLEFEKPLNKTWKSAVCIFSPLGMTETNLVLSVRDFCSSSALKTRPVVDLVFWNSTSDRTESYQCPRRETKNTTKEGVQANLKGDERLNLTVSVREPQDIVMTATATLGLAHADCMATEYVPRKGDSTTQKPQQTTTAEEQSVNLAKPKLDSGGGIESYPSMAEVDENSSTEPSQGASLSCLIGGITGGLLFVICVSSVLFIVKRRRRTISCSGATQTNRGRQLNPREITSDIPTTSQDDGEYDHVGRWRTRDVTADPTYGHLELCGDEYGHLQRGSVRRTLVIKGDNLYGHLCMADGDYEHAGHEERQPTELESRDSQ